MAVDQRYREAFDGSAWLLDQKNERDDKMTKTLTEKRRAKVAKLYNNGVSYVDMATRLGMTQAVLEHDIKLLRKSGAIGYRYNKQKIKITIPANDIPKFLSADTGQIVYTDAPQKEFGLPEAALVVAVLILVATGALVLFGG